MKNSVMAASVLFTGVGNADTIPRTKLSAAVAEFHAARRFAGTRSGRIAYVAEGKGPAAIFLHGFPLNGFHWRDVMAKLGEHRCCIAPDFLGLGYTETPAGTDLSPISQADMVAALMDALGVRAADIVSNDSATTVAQLLAVRHHGRVRSLLLTNGDVHTNSPPQVLKQAIEAAKGGEKMADNLERHLTEPGFAQSPEGLGTLCYTDPANLTQEAMEVYFRPLLASPLKRAQYQDYAFAFEPNPLPSIEANLRRCQIPARILWGTGDTLFPTKWAHWLDSTLPNSQGVRLIEGAKLFFTEEYPDLVVREALALWNEVG